MLEALTWNSYFRLPAFWLEAYYLGIAICYYPTQICNTIFGKAKQFDSIPQSEKANT